ncbi:MAG: hypothetical protein WBN25_06705, partial [Eudoraea sp.]
METELCCSSFTLFNPCWNSTTVFYTKDTIDSDIILNDLGYGGSYLGKNRKTGAENRSRYGCSLGPI